MIALRSLETHASREPSRLVFRSVLSLALDPLTQVGKRTFVAYTPQTILFVLQETIPLFYTLLIFPVIFICLFIALFFFYCEALGSLVEGHALELPFDI